MNLTKDSENIDTLLKIGEFIATECLRINKRTGELYMDMASYQRNQHVLNAMQSLQMTENEYQEVQDDQSDHDSDAPSKTPNLDSLLNYKK